MQLVIPEGAQVHISVGHSPQLALPNATGTPSAATTSGARILKGFLAALVVFGAFQIGRFVPRHADALPFAQAAVASRSPGSAPPTVAGEGTPNPSEIPPAFRDQLAQPPQMVPAPGHVATSPDAPSPPNPFGLHE